MGKIIRVNSVARTSDEDFIDTYLSLKEYMDISEHLNDEDLSELNEQLSTFQEVCMKIMDTRNLVVIANIGEDIESLALVELDYLHTGESLAVTKFFEENGEYYVEMKSLD